MKLRIVKEKKLAHGNMKIELRPNFYKLLLKLHIINSKNWHKTYYNK